jgi:hypothetical protein
MRRSAFKTKTAARCHSLGEQCTTGSCQFLVRVRDNVDRSSTIILIHLDMVRVQH